MPRDDLRRSIGVLNLMPGTVASVNGGLARVRLESGVEVEARRHRPATGERVPRRGEAGEASDQPRRGASSDGQASVEGAWFAPGLPRHHDSRSSFGCRATFR